MKGTQGQNAFSANKARQAKALTAKVMVWPRRTASSSRTLRIANTSSKDASETRKCVHTRQRKLRQAPGSNANCNVLRLGLLPCSSPYMLATNLDPKAKTGA